MVVSNTGKLIVSIESWEVNYHELRRSLIQTINDLDLDRLPHIVADYLDVLKEELILDDRDHCKPGIDCSWQSKEQVLLESLYRVKGLILFGDKNVWPVALALLEQIKDDLTNIIEAIDITK